MILDGYMDPLWLGTQQSLTERYLALVKARSFGPADWAAVKQEALSRHDSVEGPFGEFSDIVTRTGNTAIVSIRGGFTNSESWMNEYMGLLSYPRIRSAVAAAANGEGITQILLNMESPGGQVTGISETASFLRGVGESVPIYTYAGGTMASAAYWIGSVGKEIYTSDLSNVGSIGVIAVHMEKSRMLEEGGITATVLRQGQYKALGNPYEKLSDEAKAEIMASMGKVYERFTAHVADARGLPMASVEQWAEGRVFFGYEAVANGLADDIISLEKVLEVIDRKRTPSGTVMPVHRASLKGDSRMKLKLTAQQEAALAEGASIEQVLSEAELQSLSAEDLNSLEKSGQPKENVAVEPEAQADDAENTADLGEGPSNVSLEDRLMAKVESLQEANAELKAAAKSKDQELSTLNSQVSQLKGIVASSINRMQVGLGGAANQVAAEDDADTLLSMHARTKALFESRFPVGGRAEVQTNDQDSEDARQATFRSPNVSAVRIRNPK